MYGTIQSRCVTAGTQVVTSNRAPLELPRHGLHEAMFSHFLTSLTSHCALVRLDTQVDYREELLKQGAAGLPLGLAGGDYSSIEGGCVAAAGLYAHPLSQASREHLDRLWAAVTAGEGAPAPREVPVAFGRRLRVPVAAGGAARFDFADLCAITTGPADFMALATNFHTVVLDNVRAPHTIGR